MGSVPRGSDRRTLATYKQLSPVFQLLVDTMIVVASLNVPTIRAPDQRQLYKVGFESLYSLHFDKSEPAFYRAHASLSRRSELLDRPGVHGLAADSSGSREAQRREFFRKRHFRPGQFGGYQLLQRR